MTTPLSSRGQAVPQTPSSSDTVVESGKETGRASDAKGKAEGKTAKENAGEGDGFSRTSGPTEAARFVAARRAEPEPAVVANRKALEALVAALHLPKEAAETNLPPSAITDIVEQAERLGADTELDKPELWKKITIDLSTVPEPEPGEDHDFHSGILGRFVKDSVAEATKDLVKNVHGRTLESLIAEQQTGGEVPLDFDPSKYDVFIDGKKVDENTVKTAIFGNGGSGAPGEGGGSGTGTGAGTGTGRGNNDVDLSAFLGNDGTGEGAGAGSGTGKLGGDGGGTGGGSLPGTSTAGGGSGGGASTGAGAPGPGGGATSPGGANQPGATGGPSSAGGAGGPAGDPNAPITYTSFTWTNVNANPDGSGTATIDATRSDGSHETLTVVVNPDGTGTVTHPDGSTTNVAQGHLDEGLEGQTIGVTQGEGTSESWTQTGTESSDDGGSTSGSGSEGSSGSSASSGSEGSAGTSGSAGTDDTSGSTDTSNDSSSETSNDNEDSDDTSTSDASGDERPNPMADDRPTDRAFVASKIAARQQLHRRQVSLGDENKREQPPTLDAQMLSAVFGRKVTLYGQPQRGSDSLGGGVDVGRIPGGQPVPGGPDEGGAGVPDGTRTPGDDPE